MHRLKIHKLGPIENCELTCAKFMAFSGYQASGKSTIAKALFFFRTIKDDIYSIVEKNAIDEYSGVNTQTNNSLKTQLIEHLREKFMRVFGSSWAMDNSMTLEYYYTQQCYVRIELKESTRYFAPNYIWVELSQDLTQFLDEHADVLSANALGIPEVQKIKFQSDLQVLFDDIYETVYIPAGRSIITLLTQQLSYVYTTMGDARKRSLDYCTQSYIERILSLKPEFSNGLEGVIEFVGSKNGASKATIDLAYKLIRKVLRGSYSASNGEERINISDNRYVKLNFASSGQQESVWILNLLFYYLVKNTPVLFIIEEPESNLFPESQKYITEFISLVNNSNHSVVVTTHSPYVLGTLNNLLYAGQIRSDLRSEASDIISDKLWIDFNCFDAWFVKNGGIESCIDNSIHLIQNEKIDEISKVINSDFDRLFDLQIDDQ